MSPPHTLTHNLSTWHGCRVKWFAILFAFCNCLACSEDRTAIEFRQHWSARCGHWRSAMSSIDWSVPERVPSTIFALARKTKQKHCPAILCRDKVHFIENMALHEHQQSATQSKYGFHFIEPLASLFTWSRHKYWDFLYVIACNLDIHKIPVTHPMHSGRARRDIAWLLAQFIDSRVCEPVSVN